VFLIINDEKIVRIRESLFLIGSAPDAGARLDGATVDPYHCEIYLDEKSVWWFRNRSPKLVSVNGDNVPAGRIVRLKQSCVVRVPPHFIQVRMAAGDTPVSRVLREKLFHLEDELHRAVLDQLKLGSQDAQHAREQQKLEEELERQFRLLRIDPELETYLATQAIQNLLNDQVHGWVSRAGERTKDQFSVRREMISERVAELMQLTADRVEIEKTERIQILVPWVLKTHKDMLTGEDRRSLAICLLREELNDMMFGLGPLQDLLRSNDINDIMVLPSGHIFIERKGQMQDSGRRMALPVARHVVERIVTSQGRRIDQTSPMVDARVSDGSRLNAIIEPVAVNGPALTIRKFSDKRWSLTDLVTNGSLTKAAADFLSAAIIARKSIVVSGGTGSGKTTLVNALASFIPEQERIITVEDTAELRLPQLHVVTLQSKPANLEGKGEVTIRQLIRNTLRMRPDRIIVGECRGGETLDMLQAMNTGHDGSMTTIHANTPWDAMQRIETMAMQAEGVDLPSRALREQIVSAVDIVIQISRVAHRTRRVISVAEVVGLDEENGSIILEEVYSYRKRKSTGMFTRSALVFTGYIPTFFDDLIDAGADLNCLE
jgi:pilus assembly protein CpaF